MRNISILTASIFLIIFWAISLLAWFSLIPLLKAKSSVFRRNITISFFTLGVIESLTFWALFVFPFNATTATQYSVYFYFNALLLTDMVAKIPLVFSVFFQWMSRAVRYRRILSVMGLILAFGILLINLWGLIIGIKMVNKQQFDLNFDALPPSFHNFRVMHISDIHLGSFYGGDMLKRIAKINSEFKPDVILFTGDLVNNFAFEVDGWESVFDLFTATYGKFGILGNHDYGNYFKWEQQSLKDNNFELICKAYADFGYRLLRNESEKIKIGADSIYILGVENWGHPPFPQYAKLDSAEAQVANGAFRILLTHDPAHWESIIQFDKNYPLSLSGHTHGMQWGIKLAGIEFSVIYFLRKYWAGLYENDGQYLIVSRGLGTIGMPFRIDMPAEINLITLKRN